MTVSPNTLGATPGARGVRSQHSLELHVLALLLLLAVSILPELLWGGAYTSLVQVLFLLLASLVCLALPRWRPIWGFACILLTIDASFLLTAAMRSQTWWVVSFQWAGALSAVSANIAVKVIGIVPVVIVLLALLSTWKRAYLLPGDLARKADVIPWLGIQGGSMAWGKLALIAGLLVTLGTALLAMLTTTGFALPVGMGRLLPMLPLIVVLALVNSFCEGLVFRSALMAPLRGEFGKFFVLLLPALFFGIAHTQGVPGGLLGGVMSGVLAYFMCLSVYETEGFAAGWIIHFLQDVTIFSLLLLLA